MGQVAFCFDLDGTVTKEEILPLIAKEAGIVEEIKILTDITLKGLIPFEKSFKLRVKLLASIPISNVKKVVNNVKLDSRIVEFIKANKKHCYIVTGNLDVWVKDFITKELGCQSYTSKADFLGDKLFGINNILNKGKAIHEIRKGYKKIIVIGDSMNDCSMFEEGDVQIAYGGVHNPTETLIQLSKYVTFNSKALVNLLKLNLINED